MSDIKLKIKFLTLANEAKLIKHEERKALRRGRRMKGIYSKRHRIGEEQPAPPREITTLSESEREVIGTQAYNDFWGLNRHRLQIVRKAARVTHLARNFLKGHSYDQVEASCHELPAMELVFEEVARNRHGKVRNDPAATLLREEIFAWFGYKETPDGLLKVA